MSGPTSSRPGPFSPVVVGFLVAGVVAIFALSVVLLAFGGGHETSRSASATPSAIGHLGFYTLLDRLGLPVADGRLDGDAPAGADGLLIVDEPQDAGAKALKKALKIATADRVLVVLPKRWGKRDEDHDGWVEKVGLLDLDRPQAVLDQVVHGARVLRQAVLRQAVLRQAVLRQAGMPADGAPAEAGARPPGANRTPRGHDRSKPAASSAPVAAPLDAPGAAPAIEGEVQLVSSKVLTPLIGTADRMLLGTFGTGHRRVWVLADPDPLENFGLQKPANVRFAMALVKALRGGADGRIVFDDTIHEGRARTRSPLQLLFQWPYVLVTVQILVALALLLAATTARFGGAEPAPIPIALGKLRLIENIAALMDRAGHQAVVLRRYIRVKLHEAGRALHAPAGLDDDALATWLDRIGTSRGLALKAAAILESSAATRGGRKQTLSRLFREARDMDRWNREILHGSGGRKDGR